MSEAKIAQAARKYVDTLRIWRQFEQDDQLRGEKRRALAALELAIDLDEGPEALEVKKECDAHDHRSH